MSPMRVPAILSVFDAAEQHVPTLTIRDVNAPTRKVAPSPRVARYSLQVLESEWPGGVAADWQDVDSIRAQADLESRRVVDTQTLLDAFHFVRHDFKETLGISFAQDFADLVDEPLEGAKPFASPFAPTFPVGGLGFLPQEFLKGGQHDRLA
jgi:hypothetical protein